MNHFISVIESKKLEKKANLSPAIAVSQLSSIREIISLPDRTIYQLVKIKADKNKHSYHSAMEDINIAKQMALLIFFKNDGFQLNYYPSNESPQIVKNLPMDKLIDTINELVMAGF